MSLVTALIIKFTIIFLLILTIVNFFTRKVERREKLRRLMKAGYWILLAALALPIVTISGFYFWRWYSDRHWAERMIPEGIRDVKAVSTFGVPGGSGCAVAFYALKPGTPAPSAPWKSLPSENLALADRALECVPPSAPEADLVFASVVKRELRSQNGFYLPSEKGRAQFILLPDDRLAAYLYRADHQPQ